MYLSKIESFVILGVSVRLRNKQWDAKKMKIEYFLSDLNFQ